MMQHWEKSLLQKQLATLLIESILRHMRNISTTLVFCCMKTAFINVTLRSDSVEHVYIYCLYIHIYTSHCPLQVCDGDGRLRLRCDLAVSNNDPQATGRLRCYVHEAAAVVSEKLHAKPLEIHWMNNLEFNFQLQRQKYMLWWWCLTSEKLMSSVS